MRFLTHCCMTALGLLAVVPTASALENKDAWRFDATLYLWAPSIGGRTQVPPGAAGPTIDISARDVVRKLDMAFMGSVEAHRGPWGGLVDWVYSDLSGGRSGTRDLTIGGLPPTAGVSADLGLRVKTNLLTLAAMYSEYRTPTTTAALVVGVRMLNTAETVNWSFSGSGLASGLTRTGVSEASATNWDAIIGLRGRLRPDAESRWFAPYHFDIGTGDSRRTWQAMLGVGYAFDFGDVSLGWRYVDYKFKSSQALQTLTFNGVMLGATFRFQ
jgi:opacity protein-like surface antigen